MTNVNGVNAKKKIIIYSINKIAGIIVEIKKKIIYNRETKWEVNPF